ncbi:poly(hydroxyalkanoate) depolymerase family esterase [Bradyrhizobium sp. USDA 4454]
MKFIAEEQTCFLAYPAQRPEANQAKCWNWFRPADQQRGGGEPSLVAGITPQIMRDHSVEPERVYVAGLSAGAAAAAVMGSTYGDLYAAICIHSGLACGAVSGLPSALMVMQQGSRTPAGAKSSNTGKSTEPHTHGQEAALRLVTDPDGPDATREMPRFFFEHSLQRRRN